MLKEIYTRAMRLVPAAVTIVSTTDAGQPRGLTATAVCSVSADPPQLLVCVNRSVVAHNVIRETGVFGVNYLSHDQQHIAQAFARPTKDPGDRFQNGEWKHGAHGVPLLTDAMLSVECRLVNSVDCGTHTIFIGEVLDLQGKGEASLIYKSGVFDKA